MFICMQVINFTYPFFFEILQDITNLLFWVRWACPGFSLLGDGGVPQHQPRICLSPESPMKISFSAVVIAPIPFFNSILFVHTGHANFDFNWCSIFTKNCFYIWRRFEWSKSLLPRFDPQNKLSKISDYPTEREFSPTQ